MANILFTFFVICVATLMNISPIIASSGGKIGSSINGCGGCHGGSNNATTVFLREGNGPFSLSTGESKTFKVVVAHASMPKSGVNIAVKNSSNNNAGSFSNLTNCVSSNNELTHSAPVTMTGGETEYTFTWTAPAIPGVYTLRAAGNAVNNNGGDSGDFWNVMSSITINVQASASIVINSQNNAAKYCRNSPLDILWTANGLSGTTTIEMSPTGTLPWAQIGSVPANITNFQWTVPANATYGNNYRFRVINGAVSDTNDANISVLPTPIIAIQPKAFDTTCIGGNITLSVMPDKEDPFLTYKWFKGSSAIAGANSRTYTITNAQIGASGQYSVELNGCTNLTSEASLVFIAQSPAISSHPSSANACFGSQVTLNVTATGTNLSYAWRKNGTAIANGNKAAYTISSMTANDAGQYDCIVTGTCSPAVTCNAATVQMVQIPITASNFTGNDSSLCIGNKIQLFAQGTGAIISGYIWKKNGNLLPNTDSSFTINSIASADSGVYTVTAKNQCGESGNERSIKLIVLSQPLIARNMADTTVIVNTEASLRIIALGPNLGYKWKKDGKEINNATSDRYTIAATQFADSGSYECIITNSCGTVTSSKTFLSVKPASKGPTLTLSTRTIDFGCINKGTTKDTVISALITNTGNEELNITAITLSGPAATNYSIVSGQAPFILAANETKALGLAFSPKSEIINNASIAFASNSVTSPGLINISGTSCFEDIATSPIILGKITVNKKDTLINICNTGTKAASVSELSINGSSTFTLSNPPALPLSIEPGTCKEVLLSFASNQDGTYNAELLVKISQSSNASQVFTIPLSATYASPSSISEFDMFSGISAFPNPANEILEIQSAQAIHSVRLINVLGETIAKHNIQNQSTTCAIDINHTLPGSYIAIVNLHNGKSFGLPIIIQR